MKLCFAKQALETSYPAEDILFISEDVYRYGALDEISATAFYAGRAIEGYEATKKLMQLLQENLIPDEHGKRIQDNMEQYEKVMAGVQQQQMQVNMEDQIKKIQEKKKVKEQSKSDSTKYKKKKARSR